MVNRGVCPVCKRNIAVRSDGTFRTHQNRNKDTRIVTNSGRLAYSHCIGSDTFYPVSISNAERSG